MPTLDDLYQKLLLVEQKIDTAREGLALPDDIVVERFNIDTKPGFEIYNPAIAELKNVEITSGIAITVDPAIQDSSLKTSPRRFNVSNVYSARIIPLEEDVRCQFNITPDYMVTDARNIDLTFNPSTEHNISLVPNNGQRDYGAHLTPLDDYLQPFIERCNFPYGNLENVWFLEKSNIVWTTTNITGNPETGTVLDVQVTEPLSMFPQPQYSMSRFAMAFWCDIHATKISDFKAKMSTTSGQQVQMGISFRMSDVLNGYLALLESDLTGSYVRIYKTAGGVVTKIAEASYNGIFSINAEYEVAVKTDKENIKIFINDALALEHNLDPIDIISLDGDFGIVAIATSSVRFFWIEAAGVYVISNNVDNGEIITEPVVLTDISRWSSISIDSVILRGSLEIQYSTDAGQTYLPVPFGVIEYPAPITKQLSLDSVLVDQNISNSIQFKIKFYGTGTNGWLRKITLAFISKPHSAVILDGVETYGGFFKLMPSLLHGSITMIDGIAPSQIYKWDHLIRNEYSIPDNSPPTSVLSFATVTVDSEQVGHESTYITDGSLATYWEGNKGKDGWVKFEFEYPAQLYGFRWVKKSITDGATFYHFQVHNADTNEYENVQTYGFEVNNDITHTFETPIIGKKFRIYVDCTQPFSFANARFIDLLGRPNVGFGQIIYEYSLDGGANYNLVPEDLDLSKIGINTPLKLRATITRSQPATEIQLKSFGARFFGRDSRLTQLTDLQYDLWIGDKYIQNSVVNQELDARCISGDNVQMKIRFINNPLYLFEGLRPSLSGFKLGVSSSRYQNQIDQLREQVNSVILMADKDPNKDKLSDAISVLMSDLLDAHVSGILNNQGLDSSSVMNRLFVMINKEVSILKSKVAMGDVGHLDESIPSIVVSTNIL